MANWAAVHITFIWFVLSMQIGCFIVKKCDNLSLVLYVKYVSVKIMQG